MQHSGTEKHNNTRTLRYLSEKHLEDQKDDEKASHNHEGHPNGEKTIHVHRVVGATVVAFQLT